MNRQQILATIKSLAESQGFYVRVLEMIGYKPEILDELERQKFGDEVDLVMFFEC